VIICTRASRTARISDDTGLSGARSSVSPSPRPRPSNTVSRLPWDETDSCLEISRHWHELVTTWCVN